MSKVTVRAFFWASGFAVVALLGIGIWAAVERSALRSPVAQDGHSDARAVLAFVRGRPSQGLQSDLFARAQLEDLVKANQMLGAMVLDADGHVLLRAGELEPPVVDAALEGIAATPAARVVNERILYREADDRLIAIVVEDLGRLDEPWAVVRRRALLLACAAVLLSPLVGLWLARLKLFRPTAS